MIRAFWRVEEGEVGDQSVEEGGGESMLRGQSVSKGEAAAVGEMGKMRDRDAM